MCVKTTEFLKTQMDLIFSLHLSPFLHIPLYLIKNTLKQITVSLVPVPQVFDFSRYLSNLFENCLGCCISFWGVSLKLQEKFCHLPLCHKLLALDVALLLVFGDTSSSWFSVPSHTEFSASLFSFFHLVSSYSVVSFLTLCSLFSICSVS